MGEPWTDSWWLWAAPLRHKGLRVAYGHWTEECAGLRKCGIACDGANRLDLASGAGGGEPLAPKFLSFLLAF